MAKPEDLIQVMTSEEKAWKPSDLCTALSVSIIELPKLIEKVRKAGVPIQHSKSELVGNSYKYWLVL